MGDTTWPRQYGLELDRCPCGRAIPGDLDQCDECAAWIDDEWQAQP